MPEPEFDIPLVRIGQHAVSRLIVGGNPFSGNSHVSAGLDEEMADYFTAENIKRTLRDCEAAGITAVQARGDRHIQRVLREFRNEGGSLDWIAQTASELASQRGHVKRLAELGAAAIYHHGSRTDNRWHSGRMEEVHELLKAIRDTGVAVGLGTHIPEVIEFAEENDWDVDFYMACLYNLNRTERQSAIVVGSSADSSEKFYAEDRHRMLATIRATPRPCLAFKVLAASRHCESPETTRDAFRHALTGIKPGDAMVVGMFPKYIDQVRQNAGFVAEICAAMKR